MTKEIYLLTKGHNVNFVEDMYLQMLRDRNLDNSILREIYYRYGRANALRVTVRCTTEEELDVVVKKMVDFFERKYIKVIVE